MNMFDRMPREVRALLTDEKPCAFCFWHTHDFPDDAEHNELHEAGWHACMFDGEFRESNPDCERFVITPMVEVAG